MAEQRPRRNNGGSQGLSDQALLPHAQTMGRIFASVIHVADLLGRKVRLENNVSQLEQREEALRPQVAQLEARHTELIQANASLEQEGERQMMAFKAERLEAAQQEIQRATEEFRHAHDAQKTQIQEGLEETRRQAEIEKQAIQMAITQERAEQAKVQAETQILQTARDSLRREIGAGV